MTQQMPTPTTTETSPSVGSAPGSDDSTSTGSESNFPAVKDPGKSHNTKKVSEVKGDIEVVASMKGFYNQDRKNPGDKFKVSSVEELGSWMTCVDPKHEKLRLSKLAKK